MANGRSLEPSYFEGTALKDMRSWVEGTPGAEVLFSKGEAWSEEEQFMHDLSSRVQDRMKQVGVHIESRSGGAMRNAVAPAVRWAGMTADQAKLFDDEADKLDGRRTELA